MSLDKITSHGAPPIFSLLGITMTIESITTGLNFVSAILGILVAVVGLYWSLLKIKLAKAELDELKKEKAGG
jgi:hypothetical protein